MKTCQHTEQETGQRCKQQGNPCYFPDYGRRGDLDEPDHWYCSEHAPRYGFCKLCGQFWGGIESFEFHHPGICDDCHGYLDREFGWDDECWDEAHGDWLEAQG